VPRFLHITSLVLGLLACTWLPSRASAQRTATCVELRAEGLAEADRQALDSLLRSEIDRHRTHISTHGECTSHLVVELVALEGHLYLTARIGWQVPDRVEVEGTLEQAVSELLSVVLHNDPVRLRRPDQDAGLGGALHRLKTEGNTVWELELAELSGRLDQRFFGLPSVALHYRRELAQFSLGLRVAVASRTDSRPSYLAPVGLFNVAFEVRYDASADASTSAYIGGQLGIEHQWLHGPLRSDPNSSDSSNSTGLALGLRLGVELFRMTNTRLDLFTLLSLPAFLSRDQAHDMVKAWLPTLTVGVGLGL